MLYHAYCRRMTATNQGDYLRPVRYSVLVTERDLEHLNLSIGMGTMGAGI
jgi:hypothetical protein